MKNVLVLNENYLDTEFFSAQTYSSQLTAMPATNVLNYKRRSRVWRSGGNWVITSANKGIVFQETIGVNITANIAEGTYSTDASFLLAISAALNTAGGTPTYTTTRNSTTNKIVITSNGGGGASFRLTCTDAGFTAATILGFSVLADRTGALTYTADSQRIHTEEWLKFDLGSSFNPKAFVLIGLRNTAIKISTTATVKLQGNDTDVWTAPSYDQALTYNEFSMSLFGETGLHTSALRYWRLLIQDPTNILGYVEVSNLYLGDFLTTDRGAVEFPLNAELVDLGNVSYARSGLSISDEVQLTEELRFGWNLLTVSEKEDLEDFTRQVGTTKPFFLILDPNEVFSGAFERNVKYVKFLNGPSFQLSSPGNFGSDWSIREEV